MSTAPLGLVIKLFLMYGLSYNIDSRLKVIKYYANVELVVL